MAEIAIQALVLDRGAIARHAVDQEPFNFVLFNGLNNHVKVSIQVQFLRAFEVNFDCAGIHLSLQVEAQCLCIANDLRRVLVERD